MLPKKSRGTPAHPAKGTAAPATPNAAFKKTCLKELRDLFREANRKDLLWIYEVGCWVKELHPKGDRQYGERAMDETAAKVGPVEGFSQRNVLDLLYHAREFADLYTEKDVNRLARMNNAANEVLTWPFVLRILPVENRAQRERLLQRWCEGQLSLRAWRREIQTVTRVISLGGRPPSVPQTVPEAIRQVEEMARRWLMWQGYVEKPKRDQRGKPGKSMLERLPEDMRSQLEALLDGMKTLQETASTAILHLRPVAPRPTGSGRSKVKPVKDRRGGAG